MLKNIYTKVISLEKHFVKDTPYKLWQFATSLKPEAIFTKAFHIPLHKPSLHGLQNLSTLV